MDEKYLSMSLQEMVTELTGTHALYAQLAQERDKVAQLRSLFAEVQEAEELAQTQVLQERAGLAREKEKITQAMAQLRRLADDREHRNDVLIQEVAKLKYQLQVSRNDRAQLDKSCTRLQGELAQLHARYDDSKLHRLVEAMEQAHLALAPHIGCE